MEKLVHLLWTGSWNSTYRLLELTSREGVRVQPYYIRDEKLARMDMEQHAMDKIRALLAQRFPGRAQRMAPTVYYDRGSILADEEIERKYRVLLKQYPLEEQYCWLPCYAKQLGINDLEICIQNHGGFFGFLTENCVQRNEPVLGGYYRLSPDVPEEWPLSIFHFFRFPVLSTNRAEMQERAERMGVLEILLESWFCHTPVFGEPCGRCKPCCDEAEAGCGRLPPAAVRRYRHRKIYWLGQKIRGRRHAD